MYKFKNLNDSLIGIASLIDKEGIWEETRGFRCKAIQEPVMICIDNPCDRYVTIPERKWNKVLPFVESLWIALGLNDLDQIPGNYVKSLYNYSDNGRTWRAAYGPRIRAFSGIMSDYDISEPKFRNVWSGLCGTTDQLKYIIESLKRDLNTRQAVIEIADPAKDCFNPDGTIKTTKDYPCTRLLNFQVRQGKLDLTTFMRSNDLLFGFSAINVFNFTLIQEYVANIIKVPVGKYYHVANNIHFYENMQPMIDCIIEDNKIDDDQNFFPFYYDQNIVSLEHFDSLLLGLFDYEKMLREGPHIVLIDFENDMFNDWGKVFYYHHTKKVVEFVNPYLNRLFYGN